MSFMGRLRGRHRREFENVILNNYCRYQTVGPENPLLHKVLVRFQEVAGLPFLINTSLNVEGEPVTESPEVLLQQFDTMNLDAAILDNILLLRETRS